MLQRCVFHPHTKQATRCIRNGHVGYSMGLNRHARAYLTSLARLKDWHNIILSVWAG